jgi:hypothetical protein
MIHSTQKGLAMNQERAVKRGGTLHAPHYLEAHKDQNDDVHLRTRLFTYDTDSGIVAGGVWNIVCTIDRPVKQVWPFFKDFNLWMNSYGYYWPGVLGDMYTSEERDVDRKTFPITIKKPNEPPREVNLYQLVNVIPEHMIVLWQPIVEGHPHGGVSPGFNVFMLNEQAGKTLVTITMEHATRATGKTEEEALAPWREIAKEVHAFWRDIFIPNLRKLAYKDKRD